MAEVVERVARLEERSDGVTAAIADLKVTVSELDGRMQTGFAEMRNDFSAVRGELSGIRSEMNTQFRWLMGGVGSSALVILVAVLAAILARG